MMPQVRRAILIGLAFGAGAVHLSVVGVLLMLHQRWIIIDTVSLGQAVLLVLAGGAGAMAGRPVLGLIAGAATGVPIAALAAVMAVVPLQSIFIALSPDLLTMLTFGQDTSIGALILIGGGALAGLLGAALRVSPRVVHRAIFPGAIAVLVAGVFQELIQLMLQQYELDQRLPRVHLHVGRAEPARRHHHLPGRCSPVRNRRLHLPATRGADRGAGSPTRTHGLGGPGTARAGADAGSGRRVYRPGADAGRAVHPDGDGAEPGGRAGWTARPGFRRVLRRRRLHDGIADG